MIKAPPCEIFHFWENVQTGVLEIGFGPVLKMGPIIIRYGPNPMKKMKFVVSLITLDNDYQIEQAVAADQTARSLGVDIQIIYADSDAITQSQQLLRAAIVVPPNSSIALEMLARALRTSVIPPQKNYNIASAISFHGSVKCRSQPKKICVHPALKIWESPHRSKVPSRPFAAVIAK